MSTALPVVESLAILEKYKIPVCEYAVVRQPFELSNVLIPFPWVMKLSSTKVIHKTEKKAVYTNIQNKTQANELFERLKELDSNAAIVIQPQLDGTELFIGSTTDLQFGPTIAFGIGGINVELLKDTSLSILPIEPADCRRMINEIQHQQILEGFRGKPAANKKQLEKILLSVATMIEQEQFLELDINPLIATKKGIFAVDCRIVK